MKLARTILGACALLGGCGAHGVSLGTEELCVKDARLVSAEQRSELEPVSSCAVIGENQLVNAGFEAPIVSTACGDSGLFCQFPAAEVAGWSTSSSEQVIELWLSGHMGVSSSEGSQVGELNARSRDTLWQELALPPGQLMYWSLLHRGRGGIDSLELQIGPPDALKIRATISSPEDDWYAHSGLYRVASDEALTRFALVSRNGEEEGNLVDAVVFAPVN
jgi:hypothetical protein